MSRTNSPTSTCSCGVTITWAHNPRTGRSTPCVQVDELRLEQGADGRFTITGARKVWVSHFRTCRDADRYSGRNGGTKPATTASPQDGGKG